MSNELTATHIPDAGGAMLMHVPDDVRGASDATEVALSSVSCTTASCACFDMSILVAEVSGDARNAALKFDPVTRAVEIASNDSGLLSDGLYAWLTDTLRGDLGQLLEARARRLKTRDLPFPWRSRSWTDHEPGELIAFHEAVPGELDLVVQDDAGTYWIRDLYCVAPHCDCCDVVLDILPMDSAQQAPQATVRVHLDSNTVLSAEGPSAAEVYQLVRTTYGIDELRHRYARMREMAGDKQVRFARKPAAAQAVSSKVGRNDPCPCGSGKKHKKCCGA